MKQLSALYTAAHCLVCIMGLLHFLPTRFNVRLEYEQSIDILRSRVLTAKLLSLKSQYANTPLVVPVCYCDGE